MNKIPKKSYKYRFTWITNSGINIYIPSKCNINVKQRVKNKLEEQNQSAVDSNILNY